MEKLFEKFFKSDEKIVRPSAGCARKIASYIQLPCKSDASFTAASLIITVILLVTLISLIGHYFLIDIELYQPTLNTTLNAVGAFTALTLAALIIVLKEFGTTEAEQLWVGCALLAMGLLEGLCTVMEVGNSFFWLKSLANLIGGFLFAFVWLAEFAIYFFRRFLCKQINMLFIMIALSSFSIGVLSILFSTQLPLMYLEKEGFTTIATGFNIVGSLGFLFATWYFIQSYYYHDKANSLLFGFHCLLFGVAIGVLQFSLIWDVTWWLAHLLRFAAYFTLLYYVLFLFREAVTQLQLHQQRLAIITDLAPVGIFYADVYGNSQYLNERGKEILELTPDEVMGAEWRDKIHPEDYQQVITQWQQAIQQHSPFKNQHRLQHGKWVLTQAVAEKSLDGKVTGYVGTLTDISEVKQVEEQLLLYRYYLEEMVLMRTEELTTANEKLRQEVFEHQQVEIALRESEARFTAILNSATEAIIAVDEMQRIILFNQGAEHIFGYTIPEVMEQPLEMLLPELSATIYHQHVKLFAQEATNTRQMGATLYLVGQRKNGDEFPLEGSISKIAEQHRVLFTVILRDISERYHAERALRISEQKYRTLLHEASDAIVLIDLQGHVIEANRKAEILFGYTQAEFLQKQIADLHPLDNNYSMSCQFLAQNEMDSNSFTQSDVNILTKERQLVATDITCSLVEYGEEKGFIKIIRDITDRKRIEEVLTQERASLARRVEERTLELRTANAALAKASRLKDEFLANITHELRTPLNAILTISEGLQEQTFGELNEKQLKYLKTIQESGAHLLEIINDILDLSKIEAGKIELQITEIDVELLCQNCLYIVKATAAQKQQQLFYEMPEKVTTVPADGRRLKQVLVNLLGNAVKFTPENGKIGLRVTQDETQHTIHFTIWDTGIGIAPQDQLHLFQPFTQVDSRLARHYEGTGLGLAIVKRLVELHHGQITLQSTVGVGSQFTVSLPINNSSKRMLT